MLTESEVRDIFAAHVPTHVTIRFVPRMEFILTALQNKFIQAQIEAGIYNAENIWTDFLSAACAYSSLNVLEICYDLIVSHCEGVENEDLIRAYITMMAAHEGHHFHVDEVPNTIKDVLEAEIDCLRETTQANPDLSSKTREFEAQSVIYQRVFGRLPTST